MKNITQYVVSLWMRLFSNLIEYFKGKEQNLIFGAVGLSFISFSLTVGSNLIVTRNIQQIKTWDQQLNRYIDRLERLDRALTDLNAPANDIFTSGNTKAEQNKLAEAKHSFDQEIESLAMDLSRLEGIDPRSAMRKIIAIKEASQKMTELSEETLQLYKDRQLRRATTKMSAADDKFKEIRHGLAEVKSEWRQQDQTNTDLEVHSINSFSRFTVVISFLNGLLILFLIASGYIMFRNLQDSEKQSSFYKFALDQVAIIATTDRRGIITYANEAFAKISGYPLDELLGQDHRLLNSGLMGKGFFASMWKQISAGQVWRGEICNRTKDGHLYWVDSIIVPTLDRRGRVTQYTAIRIEITDRKLNEERILKSNEVALAAAQTKAEFLANMSHEIRTPMNGIIGMCNLLLDSCGESQHTEKLKIIQTSSQSLLDIINDILDFSKVESGKLELENEPFSISNAVNDIIKLMNAKASEKGLLLIYEPQPNVPDWIYGDVTRFRQILTNLVSNGLKFTNRGQIRILASAQKQDENDKYNIQFAVQDTGIGIPKEQMPKLFKSFSQGDTTTTRRFGGTGLGLAISKALCENMGGTMEVHSEVGIGSTFQFNLLAKKASAQIENSDHISLSAQALQLSQNKPLRILVAEDNRVNQLVIHGLLSRLGYQPQIVNNGLEVLETLKTSSFDLILMDCHMPQMDGFEATMKIATMFSSRIRPKVIALTASAMKQDIERCQRSGMDGFLSKPIVVSDLIRELQQTKPLDI